MRPIMSGFTPRFGTGSDFRLDREEKFLLRQEGYDPANVTSGKQLRLIKQAIQDGDTPNGAIVERLEARGIDVDAARKNMGLLTLESKLRAGDQRAALRNRRKEITDANAAIQDIPGPEVAFYKGQLVLIINNKNLNNVVYEAAENGHHPMGYSNCMSSTAFEVPTPEQIRQVRQDVLARKTAIAKLKLGVKSPVFYDGRLHIIKDIKNESGLVRIVFQKEKPVLVSPLELKGIPGAATP